MVRSNATTVKQYLSEISDDQRGDVEAVRDLVLENLPDGYVETMRWGMITYEVPLETYPDTYNGKPLMFVALAAQKRHLALYLTNVAFVQGGEEAFKTKYLETGKKMDMGRSCLRFKSVDDLATDVIAESINSMPVDEFVRQYEVSRTAR
jgi:hypothetical protein